MPDTVEEGRRKRSRILIGGLATSALSRGVAVLTPLVIVPVSLHYLGATGYGAWSASLAVTSMLLFADLGIGTGLMTKLGQISATEHSAGSTEGRRARSYVTNAYLMATFVVIGGFVLMLLTARVIPWESLLGADDSGDGSVTNIALITLAAFLANIVTSLVVRVQYGIGQQAQSNLWQTAGSLLSLAVAFVAAQVDPGRSWFVALCAFAPVVVSAFNTAHFFLATPRGRVLRPHVALYSPPLLKELVSLGSRFLLIILFLTLSTQVDPWIVAHTAGLGEVPSYSIPGRVFAVIGTIALTLTQPLWPLHAQALAAGDVNWVSSVTRRMTVVTLAVVGVAGALAAIVGPELVDIWLQSGIPKEPVLWVGLALWWFAQSATGPAFMAQNGAEILRPQTVGYVVLALSLPLKWWVSSQYGYVWIPWVEQLHSSW